MSNAGGRSLPQNTNRTSLLCNSTAPRDQAPGSPEWHAAHRVRPYPARSERDSPPERRLQARRGAPAEPLHPSSSRRRLLHSFGLTTVRLSRLLCLRQEFLQIRRHFAHRLLPQGHRTALLGNNVVHLAPSF